MKYTIFARIDDYHDKECYINIREIIIADSEDIAKQQFYYKLRKI